MTETHDTGHNEMKQENAILVQKINSLENIAASFHTLSSGEDYFGALFLIDNLPGEYDKSSLYAKLAFEIAKDLDRPKASEESVTRSLSEALLNYLKSQSGEYFKKSDPFGE